MKPLMFIIRLAAAAVSVAAISSQAAAQAEYPARPITLVVPFSAGGQFDFLGRLVASSMSKNLGQEIIVENVSGGGGNVGGAKVANAKPDGYTLLQYGGNLAIAKDLTSNLAYDPVGSFIPVAPISIAPHVVLMNNSLPVKDFKDLVNYAKAHPDRINYATPGVGTSMHLTFEEIRELFDFPATHIPYRGGSNALNDLASGQVQLGIVAVAPALPFIQSGKIRALAVTGESRAPSLPDVPTISELGHQGFSSGSWAGIAVPKGTPQAIVDRLAKAVSAAINDPQVSKRLEELSFTPLQGASADLKARIDDEARRYGPIIAKLGLKN